MHKIDYVTLLIKEEGHAFLKGVCSNSLDVPKNAFLDRHGKIITTFFQKSLDQKTMMLVIPHSAFIRLMTHLMSYMKVAHAEIEKKKWHVYIGAAANGTHSIDCGSWCVNVSEEECEETMDVAAFNQFRLDNDVPLQDVDYTNEMVLNVTSDFVSLTKGCYVGQEVVARISHRSKAPKKLVVVQVSDLTDEQKERATSVTNDRAFLFVKNE